MERFKKIKQVIAQENAKKCPKYGMKKLSIGFVSCVIGFTLFFSPVFASANTNLGETDANLKFIERDIVNVETKMADGLEDGIDTQSVPDPFAQDVFEGDKFLKIKEIEGVVEYINVKFPRANPIIIGLSGTWTIVEGLQVTNLDSEIINGEKYILVPIPDSINLKENDEIIITNQNDIGRRSYNLVVTVQSKNSNKITDQTPGDIDIKVVDDLKVENGKPVPKNTIALLLKGKLDLASTSSSYGLSIAGDGRLVGTANITDWRKGEKERQIKLTVTYFYQDFSRSTLGFIEKEIPVTVKANTSDKTDVIIPKDKVLVLDLNKLTDAEREEVKNKILALNKFPQGTNINVDDLGNVTILYQDGSTDKISKEELVAKKVIRKENKKEDNKGNKKDSDNKNNEKDNNKDNKEDNKKDNNKNNNKNEIKKENKKINKNKNKKDDKKLQDKKELKNNNKNIAKETKKDSRKSSYLMGYGDGTIRPDANVTRAEAVAMIARLMGYSQDKSKEIYADGNGWFNSYLSAAYSAGILEEKMGENFRPNENITRAELAQMISHIDKKNDAKAPFKDIAGHKYEAAIGQIFGNGRIKGYEDGTFKPDREITRAEIATMLNRLFDRKIDKKDGGMFKEYKDLNKNHWAYYEIMEASRTDR